MAFVLLTAVHMDFSAMLTNKAEHGGDINQMWDIGEGDLISGEDA